MTEFPYPFDSERYIGTVSQIGPESVRANLPQAGIPGGRIQHGHRVGCGEVGEFVIIECDELAVFGRILDVRLPERERLAVEPDMDQRQEVHPLGMVQLLATVAMTDGEVVPGIDRYPRIGARVFSAHPHLVRWLVQDWKRRGASTPVLLDVATLPEASQSQIGLTPEQLFGRHCAVLGATGGGKSWTVARLIEQAIRYKAKVVLLDATGEFYKLSGTGVAHYSVGDGPLRPPQAEKVEYPYTQLTESDLFGIFSPSGQSQGPMLREAIKSLKVAKADPTQATGSNVIKSNKVKKSFFDAYERYVTIIESANADFDIRALARQVSEECVWPSGGSGTNPDPLKWGGPSNEVTYCVPLQMRIEGIIQSRHLACVFSPTGARSVPEVIAAFVADGNARLLRISLQNVPFGHNAREIVANAIGRCLLDMARTEQFKECPMLIVLDEAHQFLNKSLGDEASKMPLEAFGLIAKEGRKFGLNICIATQRPRDIPDDVLSQMGTLIVHRLINDADRKVVERASGDIDRSAAAFLPTLGPGEAIIIGVDVPVPLSVKMQKPVWKPDSKGPDFQKHWMAT